MQKAFILSLLIVSFSLTGLCQNTDQMFKKAQNLAFNNQWKEAREMARSILQINPKYQDAIVLIGRTYAWDHKFDSAKVEIKKVFAIDSSYYDAIDAMVDIEFWDGKLDDALNYCNKGLSYYPNDKELLMKKAKILLAQNKEEEARSILAKLLDINPNSYEVNSMLVNLKKFKNQINLEHTFDFYIEPNVRRWHMTSLQFQRNTKNGSIIGKLNVGQLVTDGTHYLSNPNYQFEIDAYPIIQPRLYIYLNYGYSPNKFFPRNRFGLEPFVSLKKGWEISAGFRLLSVSDTGSTNSTVLILTGSVGKYFGNNWISYRPYITFSPNGDAVSNFLYYRHYLNTPENYVGGMVGYGISPDDKSSFFPGLGQYLANSYHARIDFQHKIGKQFLIRFLSEYMYEEYQQGTYRNRFINDLYLSFYF